MATNEKIVSLLKSALAEDRMQGLELLAESDHPKALKLLAAFYKRETDPEVKALAAEVGRKLKQREEADIFDEFQDDPQEASAPATGTPFDDAMFEEKRKRKRGYREEVSWNTAFIDLGAYGLVSGAIVFLMMLSVIFAAGNIFEEAVRSEVFVGEEAMVMAEAVKFLNTLGMGLAIGYGIATAIGSVIAFVFMAAVIHYAATAFLGGDGSYTGLIHEMSVPMIVSWLVSGVITGVMMFIVFASFPDLATLQNNAQSIEEFDRLSGLMNTLSTINTLLAIGFAIWLAYAIGKNYLFGTVKGCASIIMGYMMMVFMMCGCIFTLIYVL